jgi:hypothetical protein
MRVKGAGLELVFETKESGKAAKKNGWDVLL